jgi:DNA-binding NarL/FixJ family response regulator
MINGKIFTFVSPKSNESAAVNLCSQIPIVLRPVETIEELFPLLSDPTYHTDFVAVCLDSLKKSNNDIDMFNVLLTLDTLIKSTVRRVSGSDRPQRRDTKIILLVTEKEDVKLIRQVLNLPYIYAVAKVLEREEQVSDVIEYVKKLSNGEITHDPDILERLKSKKKSQERKNGQIYLTNRQEQVLNLIQNRGASNKTIAKILGLSESTVKLHMGAILKKYGVKNRTQLALFSK